MPFVFVSVVANFFRAMSDVFVAFSAERASRPRQAVLIMLFCDSVKRGALWLDVNEASSPALHHHWPVPLLDIALPPY